jgi:hypothetical protein
VSLQRELRVGALHPASVVAHPHQLAPTLEQIDLDPASSAFSTNSFTTAAGRSITSPAAIWLLSVSSSRWMHGTSQSLANSSRSPAPRGQLELPPLRGFKM